MTEVLTRVAEIAYELAPRDHSVDVVASDGFAIELQPAGVRLDNDGCRRFWVTPGSGQWTLAHDGVGWRATLGEGDGHVYRLADDAAPKDTFVSWMPLAGGGRVELEAGTIYTLEWVSNHNATAMELCLSTME